MNAISIHTGKSLRERALEAAAAAEQDRIESERRQAEGERLERIEGLEYALRSLGIAVGKLDSDVVEIEGLRLAAIRNRYSVQWSLVVLGDCPTCGFAAESDPIRRVQGFAPHFERFVPSESHRCMPAKTPTPEAPLSFADRLEVLIREIARDEAMSLRGGGS